MRSSALPDALRRPVPPHPSPCASPNASSARQDIAGHGNLDKGGLDSDANRGNIQKVRDRVRHHQEELTKVKQARASTTPADLSGAYADEANTLFNEYRERFAGRARKDVDAAALSGLCDRILLVAQNMGDLYATSALPGVDKNLLITWTA